MNRSGQRNASLDNDVVRLSSRVEDLEAVIAELHVGVIVRVPGSETVLANSAALALLDLDADQIVDSAPLHASWSVCREDGTTFPDGEAPIPDAVRNGAAVHDVVIGVTRPSRGDRVWLMANVDPVEGPDGRIAHVLATFADITESRRAEIALAESESLNRRILDAVPGGIFHVDATGTYVRANAEALRTLGLTASDLGSATVQDLENQTIWEDGTPCPPADYPAVKCLATGRRQSPATIGVRRSDGSTSWAIYAAIPLFEPESQSVAGAVVTFVDITERKQIEEHLRHVQRVEAVARLAGGIAHHFNNLLTVINGYASLMMKRLDPSDPLSDDAAEIRKAADRAAQLTRQLLAFNRRHVVDRRVVDVNAVVSDMRPMLSPLFGELVRLEVDLRAQPSTVWADPAQIEDVVLNLAVNARDAMPRGGSFTISTRSENVAEPDTASPDARQGRYVVLRAVDAGVGISPDILAHIFEPFFTTKEVGKGTGLGLSTVHEIVRQSGGWIDVRSEAGRGASFAIYLPAYTSKTIPEISEQAREVRRGRETILVVEDDDSVRAYLRETLTRSGYRVLEAANGVTALELSGTYPGSISLLVTDVVMPGMGGPELASRLVETRPRIRSLLVSGYGGDSVPTTTSDGSPVHALQKPFSSDDLVEKVRGILDED